jgi:hypothetical protein
VFWKFRISVEFISNFTAGAEARPHLTSILSKPTVEVE